MPTAWTNVLPILLLIASNVFMTFAWYGQLKVAHRAMSLGFTSTVGIIKATDVDDASAVCSPVSGSGFQTGDRVRAVSQ